VTAAWQDDNDPRPGKFRLRAAQGGRKSRQVKSVSKRAISLAGSFIALRKSGAFFRGRYDRAIADFNQAVKIDPSFARAYINRGITLHRNSDFDRAFADVDQAIRTNPNIFDVIRRANLDP